MEKFQFPKGFLWGAATSAHQVEGNNHNDWSEWEQKREKGIGSRVKAEQFPDFLLNAYPSPLDPQNYISGRASDHYNRFQEDFDIAKSLGHNAHRFSIEWSRIEPEEGKWNENEIAHYQEVISTLRERQLEPLVTLWHWTLPLWVAKQGGWENKKTVNDFARYAEKIASSIRGVKFWNVLNEPEFWIANAYGVKKFPAPKKNLFAGIKAYWNLASVHKIAYKKLKEINPNFMVGIVESTGWIAPDFFRWLLHGLRNFTFPWLVHGHFDFFGLNYYCKNTIFGNTHGKISDTGLEIYPEGLYKMLLSAYKNFKKPIFVTENGIADAKDQYRAKFIKEHVGWMARAMKKGVDVRGYMYWSLLDNFELPGPSGFWPRFGLVEINYDTMERKIRPSAWEYKKIIENNSIEI